MDPGIDLTAGCARKQHLSNGFLYLGQRCPFIQTYLIFKLEQLAQMGGALNMGGTIRLGKMRGHNLLATKTAEKMT